MKLDARWTFPCSVDQFWQGFDDPDWNAREQEASDQRSDVLDERQEGDVTVRRTRFRSSMKLPALVASRMGSDTLNYELINRVDRANGALTWEVVPPALKDKLVASGAMRVRPIAGGCEQVLEGEVRVAIPLVGGQIEKGIVSGILEAHEATAERRRAWLKARFG